MKQFAWHRVLPVLVVAGAFSFVGLRHSLFADPGGQDQWAVMGQGLDNSRNQASEHNLSTSNVNQLSTKWTFTTSGDVSATPTLDDHNIYFPDWGGNLYALDRDKGTLKWSHQISEYDGVQGAFSRVSPAVHGDQIIIGDTQSAKSAHDGADMMAVSADKGELLWITKVDNNSAAVITGSPVVVGDVVYVGVSSNEEGLATQAGYACCSFRGSVVALNANSGRILWKRYMTPDNLGATDQYSGNAVWQPPAIDQTRGLLYIGTGNNYEVPDSVKACLSTSPTNPMTCFAADDYFDSAMALDLQTGQVKWSRRLQGFDIWTVACIRNPNPMSCPVPSSPDYDLGGSGPNLFPNLVGFGQKSGIYWALNPDNGNVIWSSVVGPGGTLGGIEWGTATDGKRIYVAVTNAKNSPYPLVGGTTTTWGAWTALDVNTGHILWQTADPDQAFDTGSVSVANGLLFAPSISGNMHVLDTSTGSILWSFQSGGSVLDGPSISKGVVYWGSGYKSAPQGKTNNKVYAFSVKGKDD